MAKTATAWRCSQCGTVNEPGARACRQCGKWPSLFDLQDSAVEDRELEIDDEPGAFEVPVELEPEEFEPEQLEPEQFEPEQFEPEQFEPEIFGEEAADEPVEAGEARRRFPRWLITVAVVVGWLLWYLIIPRVLPD